MADQVLPISWLRRVGYAQSCVARGIVSWGSKDNDAAGELQLWYHERDHDYCIYARKTASDDDVAVCKVVDVFTLHFQKCTDKIKTNVINEEVEISFLPILKTNSIM